MTEFTLECDVHFRSLHRGRKQLQATAAPAATVVGPGRVPRVARLLALAHRFQELIRSGQVADYAELARLGHVSRARISQVMNLLYLAPDLQEEVLFLPPTEHGRDTIRLRQLLPVAQAFDWKKQRLLWRKLSAGRQMGQSRPDFACRTEI